MQRRTRRKKSERGSMLLELLFAMVVLSIGLGGLLIMLVSSMYTDTRSGQDTTSTMVAEHVMEQISAQPANANANLNITDCAGTNFAIATLGALKGAGNSNANGGNGANLTGNGTVDWTQDFANVPAGYAIRYVSCNAGGRRTDFDIRWNVIGMTAYTRMVFVSARPWASKQVGGLRYVVPANLRTIGGV